MEIVSIYKILLWKYGEEKRNIVSIDCQQESNEEKKSL